MPVKNPAHSRETYPAPTTRVLPGDYLSQKTSSEVITCSDPSTFGIVGLPPTATLMNFEVTIFSLPSLSTSLRV